MNEIFLGDFRNYATLFTQDVYVISDPPYNQGYHYDKYLDDMDLEQYGEMLQLAFGDMKSVVIHYPEETVNILGKVLGECSEIVSWVYPSNTGKQSRSISWWNCKPDFRKIPQPYKNPTDKRIAKRIAEGKSARGYDWWEINQVKNVSKAENAHPCPIPLELAKRIIQSTTEKGDLIIDPFAGSGTICVAAKLLGRNFIGIEVSPEYVKIANERLARTEDETPK